MRLAGCIRGAQVDSPTTQFALNTILAAIGLRESECGAKVTITGKDPVLSSRHRFGKVMAAAQAALGIALAGIWKMQTGNGQDVASDVALAVRQHHSIHFMRQNGRKIPFVDDPAVFALTKEFYPTRDGRLVKIETFYPRVRDAVFSVLHRAHLGGVRRRRAPSFTAGSSGPYELADGNR